MTAAITANGRKIASARRHELGLEAGVGCAAFGGCAAALGGGEGFGAGDEALGAGDEALGAGDEALGAGDEAFAAGGGAGCALGCGAGVGCGFGVDLNSSSRSSTVGRLPGAMLKHLNTVFENCAGKSAGTDTVSSGHAVVR